MIELLEQTDQRNLQAQLIARAWYDESFKERLLADPRSAIGEELDLQLPAHLQVTVLEETSDTLFLLLPGNGRPIFGDYRNGSAEPPAGSERDLRAELIARANQDATFREELLTDPRRAIEKELGIQLPEHLRVTVAEETPTHHFLLLPINRTVLAEEGLNALVGGTGGDCATNPCASSSNCCASGCGCDCGSCGSTGCGCGACNGCNTSACLSSSNCCW